MGTAITVDSVGFIGGGNMGFALAKAASARFPDLMIHVCDPRPERTVLFGRELPRIQVAAGSRALAAAAEVVVIAVKPQDIEAVLREIADTERLVLSIAAGVPIRRLQAVLTRARVVRVMPNTPCLVGEMAAGYAFGSRVTHADRRTVNALLGAAGYAVPVAEPLLDAVTGLSGSGPAFVARLIEAFIEAGRGLGLPEEAARRLTLQTFLGTARLLAETGMTPEELVRMVSSPKGTTVAGREVLEGSDCGRVIADTIRAAAKRSEELGR